MQYIVVLVTVPNNDEAVKLVRHLLSERLIACANIVGSISSHFLWEGEIEKVRECLIIMKTQHSLFKRIITRVTEIHSYQVPEVIALPIISGSPSYLDWLSSALGEARSNGGESS